MQKNYWSAQPVLKRRRVLVAAAAAALLAACGGSGSSKSSGQASKSGLITEPVDTSSKARRGGAFNDSKPADINNWDINITSSAQLSNLAPFAYSRPLQPKAGVI